MVLFNIKNILRINNEIKREDLYKFSDFPYFAIDKKNFLKKFDSGLTLFSAHHCWSTPSPCGNLSENLDVIKKRGYYFIIKDK